MVPFLLQLVVSILVGSFTFSFGDIIDDVMLADMKKLNVRGAGITFFDSVRVLKEKNYLFFSILFSH